MARMAELTSKEFNGMVDKRTVAILPIGALEEHGDHLPLGTDTLQPEYVVDELEKILEGRINTLVAPTIPYGLIQSTLNFPGSVTLRFNTLKELIYDVIKGMADNKLKNIVVLSGHAGRTHMTAIRQAVHKLIEEREYSHLKIMVLSDYDIAYGELSFKFPDNDGHAGELETSRVMAIKPELVKGKGTPCFPNFPKYRVLKHPEKYFQSGVMGDPRPASREKGEKVNHGILKELAKLIEILVND